MSTVNTELREIHTILKKFAAIIDENNLRLTNVQSTLKKQQDENISKRVQAIEDLINDKLLVKLDTLNSLELNPVLAVAAGPHTVRVASAKKGDQPEPETKNGGNAKENIREYFKRIWSTDRNAIYKRGILTEKEYEKIYEDNRESLDKKKSNDIMLQKSIAIKIWKSLSESKRQIVLAMKSESRNDYNKKNSHDVESESENEDDSDTDIKHKSIADIYDSKPKSEDSDSDDDEPVAKKENKKEDKNVKKTVKKQESESDSSSDSDDEPVKKPVKKSIKKQESDSSDTDSDDTVKKPVNKSKK